MPELDSALESKRDAIRLASQLGIRWMAISLTKYLALMGVYRVLPLWLLGLRSLKATMVLRYYDGFRRALGEGETPFSAVMVGARGLVGP